jgi:hypothetical protein
MNRARPPLRPLPTLGALLATAALLGGCGGAAEIDNPAGTTGQKLVFAYYQRCIEPLLTTPLPAPQGGGSNTCSSGGCHDSVTGTGGALRLIGSAAPQDLGQDAATLRASEMYRNFYSAQGVTVPGDALASRLLTKPLVLGVLHGGGQVLASTDDLLARRIAYWVNHPAPAEQDEFSSAAAATMFQGGDVAAGECLL